MAKQLGFLSIFLILVGLFAWAWIIYFLLIKCRSNNKKHLAKPLSPTQLWMKTLTHYPRWFLFISVLIPVLLSIIGIIKSDGTIQINLDFDTYLNIDSEVDSIATNFEAAQEYQEKTANMVKSDKCDKDDGQRRELGDGGLEKYYKDFYLGQGDEIQFIYQNKNGGNVFEPQVLQDIYQFEQDIQNFYGYRQNCLLIAKQCWPIESLAQRFFQNGQLVSNMDDVVKSFLRSPMDIWRNDQYFGPHNLQSNITKSRVVLKRGPQKDLRPFLDKFYNEFLWDRDQRNNNRYPNLIFTW